MNISGRSCPFCFDLFLDPNAAIDNLYYACDGCVERYHDNPDASSLRVCNEFRAASGQTEIRPSCGIIVGDRVLCFDRRLNGAICEGCKVVARNAGVARQNTHNIDLNSALRMVRPVDRRHVPERHPVRVQEQAGQEEHHAAHRARPQAEDHVAARPPAGRHVQQPFAASGGASRDDECSICNERHIGLIFRPCCHGMCAKCWYRETISSYERNHRTVIPECPLCRQPVMEVDGGEPPFVNDE